LNSVEGLYKDKKFKESDYNFKINLNQIYDQLSQYTTFNFSNIREKLEKSIMRIKNEKILALQTIFLFYNKNYEYAF